LEFEAMIELWQMKRVMENRVPKERRRNCLSDRINL